MTRVKTRRIPTTKARANSLTPLRPHLLWIFLLFNPLEQEDIPRTNFLEAIGRKGMPAFAYAIYCCSCINKVVKIDSKHKKMYKKNIYIYGAIKRKTTCLTISLRVSPWLNGKKFPLSLSHSAVAFTFLSPAINTSALVYALQLNYNLPTQSAGVRNINKS